MDEADSYIADWHARDPGADLDTVFAPRTQRRLHALWGALLAQLDEARFDHGEPMVTQAKLGWWMEELQRGASGHARHPLGHAFFAETCAQGVTASRWRELAQASVSGDDADRAPVDTEDCLGLDRAWAGAVGAIESELFRVPAPMTGIAISGLVRRWPKPGRASVGAGWRWPLQLMARHQTSAAAIASQPVSVAAQAVAREFAAELLLRLHSVPGGSTFRACRSARDAWRLRQWSAGRWQASTPGRIECLWLSWRAARRAAAEPGRGPAA